jgi:competence protein ComEA
MPDPFIRPTHPPPRPGPRGGRHRFDPPGPGDSGAGRPGGGRFDRLRDAVADRLPAPLFQSRVTPARRAVVGFVALALAVGAILGVRLAMAAAAARPTPVGSGSSGSSSVRSSAAPASPATHGPNAAATTSSPLTSGPTAAPGGVSSLLVHVAGRVRHPGVVRLAAGARVQDALRAAGGALPGSDLVGINLAQLLSDGEQVLVARAGRGSTVSTGGSGGAATGESGAGATGSATVDLNTGDVSALDGLPGVGPVLAQRIVDWRTAHGRFTSIDELDEVSGIGDKLMAEIRPHVRL